MRTSLLFGVLLAAVGWTAAAGEPARTHWLVQVVWETDGFRVESVTPVAQPLPRWRGPARALAWRVQLLDAKGEARYTTGLEDPTLLRGEFHHPGDPDRIDAVFLHQERPVHFAVRIPAAAGGRLEFAEVKPEYRRAAEVPADGRIPLGGCDLPPARGR